LVCEAETTCEIKAAQGDFGFTRAVNVFVQADASVHHVVGGATCGEFNRGETDKGRVNRRRVRFTLVCE
jgi:hypothetical protein